MDEEISGRAAAVAAHGPLRDGASQAAKGAGYECVEVPAFGIMAVFKRPYPLWRRY